MAPRERTGCCDKPVARGHDAVSVRLDDQGLSQLFRTNAAQGIKDQVGEALVLHRVQVYSSLHSLIERTASNGQPVFCTSFCQARVATARSRKAILCRTETSQSDAASLWPASVVRQRQQWNQSAFMSRPQYKISRREIHPATHQSKTENVTSSKLTHLIIAF